MKNMNANVSVCLLLVCVSFGFAAAGMDDDRHRKELEQMPDNLKILNDKGELVAVTKNEDSSKVYTGELSFTLYRKDSGQRGQNIQINDRTNLRNSNFNVSQPTYFITHGWTDTNNSLCCTLIRDAYISHPDLNVVIVDWSAYSNTSDYIDASYNVKIAGKKVASMIKYLNSQGLSSNLITLIGHSLGAHVMGIAGYYVEPKVKHIVGLDPALPMFNSAKPGESLTKLDAQDVQIIHTNAGGLGYMCPSGHSDFYPNGGVRQDGCCDGDIVECAACSHRRAFIFFAESIKNFFNATRCDDYASFENYSCDSHPHAPMGGLNLDLVKYQGSYYLRTGAEAPFSKATDRSVSQSDFLPYFTNAFCEILDVTKY